jgi:hypothetical protein
MGGERHIRRNNEINCSRTYLIRMTGKKQRKMCEQTLFTYWLSGNGACSRGASFCVGEWLGIFGRVPGAKSRITAVIHE